MEKTRSGKTALVTGAGKRTGIGYAVAGKLAADGARLKGHDPNKVKRPKSGSGSTYIGDMKHSDLVAKYGFSPSTASQIVAKANRNELSRYDQLKKIVGVSNANIEKLRNSSIRLFRR